MNRTPSRLKGNALIAFRIFGALLLAGLLPAACADDDSSPETLEIAGSYSDDFAEAKKMTIMFTGEGMEVSLASMRATTSGARRSKLCGRTTWGTGRR